MNELNTAVEPGPIHILFVEDEPAEVELATRHLKRDGLPNTHHRVQTEADLRAALGDSKPDVILSDFSLPGFDGLGALRIARELAPDVPFIFLSGTIGEERAINALRSGAVDYILKGNLARLGPAVRRALADAERNREQRRQAAQITRLNRVLQMLSGINGLVVRTMHRADLLGDACRLATEVGGYEAAAAVLKSRGKQLRIIARATAHPDCEEPIDASVATVGHPCRITLESVLADGVDRSALCDGTRVLVLPLLIDRTPIGGLMLWARDEALVGDEELRMLRELAGNLSFGLQYLQTDSRVRFLSHFDVHTGLARRSLFCQRIDRQLAGGSNRRVAIAVIDIERLGAINTTFGRRTGDLLLQHVADRLKRRFPSTEQIARLGGGTFAITRDISGLGVQRTEDLLPHVQEHALALFGEPFDLEGRSVPVSARVGLALFPEDGRDAETLVQNAEGALQDARVAGAKHFHYRADRHTEAVARLELEHKLRTALERQQFELHYQPKVDVVTRRIQGVEALLRWNDPERGIVTPGSFLSVLESSGLIVDVGRWVIARAARDCREWQQAGLPATRVAVNIAPVQLRQADFVPEFLSHVQSWTTPRFGLDLEITESALHDDCGDEVRKLIHLRGHFVRVAVDDFGTGYSSLSRLATLPVDTLKIDRSFTAQLGSPSGDQLVKTIVALAKAFQMTTVAEGVETQEQLNLLGRLNCNQSQGFLHSHALPRDEIAQLLERGRDGLILAAERTGEVVFAPARRTS